MHVGRLHGADEEREDVSPRQRLLGDLPRKGFNALPPVEGGRIWSSVPVLPTPAGDGGEGGRGLDGDGGAVLALLHEEDLHTDAHHLVHRDAEEDKVVVAVVLPEGFVFTVVLEEGDCPPAVGTGQSRLAVEVVDVGVHTSVEGNDESTGFRGVSVYRRRFSEW